MASLGRLLFQRFPDARDEQRFRLELRRRQTKFVRALMFIGAAMLSVYVFLAPLYLSLAGTVALLLATLAMAPLLALYAWYVGRPGYAANRWIEIGFFAAMEPLHLYYIYTLHSSGVTGWPFYGVLCYNQMLLLSFASLAFAASVRQFLIWTAITVAYVVVLMIAIGYPSNVV